MDLGAAVLPTAAPHRPVSRCTSRPWMGPAVLGTLAWRMHEESQASRWRRIAALWGRLQAGRVSPNPPICKSKPPDLVKYGAKDAQD